MTNKRIVSLLLVVLVGCFSDRLPTEPREQLALAGGCVVGNGVTCWIGGRDGVSQYAAKDGVTCVIVRFYNRGDLFMSYWTKANDSGGSSLEPCPFIPDQKP